MNFDLDHFNYFASDIERAKKFYSETLGLKVVCKGTLDAFSVLISERNFIVVLRSENNEKLHGHGAVIVLRVSSLKDTLIELRSKGVVVVSGFEEINLAYQAQIQDSEGNTIKLLERKKPA